VIPQAQEQWSTDPRDRVWVAYLSAPGNPVIVRHQAIITPGEDLTEYPETWELAWPEWVASHETSYGLTIDGSPVAADAAKRAAWREMRRMANGQTAYTEANVRKAFGAFRRVLADITTELAD